MVRLVSIELSERSTKKYVATFSEEGKPRPKKVHFGAKGMNDYIIYHKDDPVNAEKRKKLYLQRHADAENWNDPMTAGALSRYILWNLPTLEGSIRDFKKRFRL